MHTTKPRHIPNYTTRQIKGFWEGINILDKNSCWEWKRSVNKDGYGRTGVAGQDLIAHRVAYFLHYNENPMQLVVCHKCDNPICCNPHHLFLGTNKENTLDMVSKGRNQIGENHIRAKITEEEVSKIKELYLTGNYHHPDLAKLFSISKRQIGRILRGEGWTHLEAPDLTKVKGYTGRKLQKEEVLGILELHNVQNQPIKKICETFSVSTSTVYAVISKRTYKYLLPKTA